MKVSHAAMVLSVGATACLGPISAGLSDAPQCEGVGGVSSVLREGGVLLLGEMHGSEQSPAFVARVACVALEEGHDVIVALEIPAEEGQRIETFLNSTGGGRDRRALLRSPFWTAEFQDGRRSEAMFRLIAQIRHWRARGSAVTVWAIDLATEPANAQERDRWMGTALSRASEQHPSSVIIALIGNVHTRVTRGVPWDADYEPAGFVLRNLRPDLALMALDVAHSGGTSWFCSAPAPSSCGAKTVAPTQLGPRSGEVVTFVAPGEGYNGWYEVGRLTASPPAILTETP